MFPNPNQAFPGSNPPQNATNNINLAALYLHPGMSVPGQTLSQVYHQAQGHVHMARQHLQRHFEQYVVQAQTAQLHALQAQAQSMGQHKSQAAQFQRLNTLSQQQQAQQMVQSQAVAKPMSINAKARSVAEVQSAELEARRRRSLIADFMVSSSPTFSDDRQHIRATGPSSAAEFKRAGPTALSVVDEVTERKKNSITDRLEAVEKEKKLVDNQLTIIQRKKEQHELELMKHLSGNGDNEKENDETTAEVPNTLSTLAEQIYTENRKKAARSQAKLPIMTAPITAITPQYRNPSDIKLVRETMERYKIVKPMLVEMVTERRKSELLEQKLRTERYNTLYAEWLRQDERYCKSQKKLARDEKHREIFEKTFPELRKRREEHERNLRNPQQCSMVKTHEDQLYNQQCTAAAIPPMMMSARERNAPFYIDLNGVIRDPLQEHKAHIDAFLSSWSEDEKSIFKEQMDVYGKNFAAIGEFLDRKTVKDCVQYYYLTKKRQNYKASNAKRRKKQQRSYRPPVMPRLEEICQKAPRNAQDIEIIGSREFECCMCRTKVSNDSSMGRIHLRVNPDPSGYDASSANEIDIQVCQKCKSSGIKPKKSTCQVGSCHNPRRKVKPTRPMPAKWKTITNEQKEFIMHDMLIPENLMKCCPACHKKISKRLDSLCNGELDGEMMLWQKLTNISWTADEIESLKGAVESIGNDNWPEIADKLSFGSRKVTADQCRQQFEKLSVESVNKRHVESEDEGSDEEAGQPKVHSLVVKLRNEFAEAEVDRSGESSATLSADEASTHDDCVIISTSSTKSPTPQLYKPRFCGSYAATPPVGTPTSIKTDAANVDDPEVKFIESRTVAKIVQSTEAASQLAELFAARLGNQATAEKVQPTTSVAASLQASVATSLSMPITNLTRGSITQGTPLIRPPSSHGMDHFLEKIKQSQMFAANPASILGNIGQTASGSATIQPGASFPFVQGAAAANLSNNYASSLPDRNLSPISTAAFLNQFSSTIDPSLQQYAMAMKLVQQIQQQQELERIHQLTILRNQSYLAAGSNLVDQQYQALGLGLSDLTQANQQNFNVFASDQARALLWHQLLQQAQAKQQASLSSTDSQQKTVDSSPAIPSLSTRQSAHLIQSQMNTELQKHGRKISGTQQPSNLPQTSSANQLYNDFRSAEQMLLQQEESAKQQNAQHKRAEDIRILEQQTKRMIEEDKFIDAEMDRILSQECQMAMIRRDSELTNAHMRNLERYKERKTAIQHHLRACFESLKALGVSGSGVGQSGVIVRGASEDRAPSRSGLVSKGAMKEFPPSVSRPSGHESSLAGASSQSLIGIKRSINDPVITNRKAPHMHSYSTSTTGDHSLSETAASSRLQRPQLITPSFQHKGIDSALHNPVQMTPPYFRGYGNVTSDEHAARTEHRSLIPGGEVKRKSGIHNVYLPQPPSTHHPPSMKNIAKTGTMGMSGHNYPHYASHLQVASGTSSASPVVSRSILAGIGSTSTASSHMPSLSANPNVPSPRSARQSPCTVPMFRGIAPNVSPFQASAIATLAQSMPYNISGSPLLMPQALSSTPVPTIQMVDNPKAPEPVKVEETVSTTGEVARPSTVASANYEPLSPDNSDSSPQAQDSADRQTAISEQNNLPLFSLLNLPDNGATVGGSSSVINPLMAMDLNDVPSTVDQRVVSVSSQSVPTSTSKPPQPTYEPLSDDE